MFDKFENLKNYLAGPDAALKEGNFAPTPLSVHDKQFHPLGYKPGDKCAYRKAAAQNDFADMLMKPSCANTDSNPKNLPSEAMSSCPLLVRPIRSCDFATKFDHRKALQALLSAFIQSAPKERAKLRTMLEGQFSWCNLQPAAREIFNALTYGVHWSRFKTLNHPNWIEIATVAKCLFGLDELALEQIFILREKIVDKKLLEHP